MPRNPSNFSTDLRGVGSLTIDAITGITDIVESLHHTIWGARRGGYLRSGAPTELRQSAFCCYDFGDYQLKSIGTKMHLFLTLCK